MTVKLMLDVNARVEDAISGDCDMVRYVFPMRARVGGDRRVRPKCFPVQYKRRHFPGSSLSQFCKSNKENSPFLD